ncbi:hypothetical protein Cgig2_033947 [Carnegiea gigantea]|uniref:Uncharacterized protein n=1 Tax=Carnegiea gigantea TaxID=171969 RepID=A0A9Q1GG32_9CARY|nr:hypothetical protein Cgig2_033947 [Carnegiea gigantea]
MGSSKGFLTRLPSFQLGIFPQPDSRRTKRKSYFQYFTFGFFSMAVMKPSLLLKQYHSKPPVSLGALWTVCTGLNARAVQVRPHGSQVAIKEHMLCHDLVLVQNLFDYRVKREPETVVESRVVNDYTFGGRLAQSHSPRVLRKCTLLAGSIASRGPSSLT